MFDHTKFMLILGADAAKWAARYNIEPTSYPCNQCNLIQTTTVPFACGQFRGLIAPKCPCGTEDSSLYCFVRDPKYGDLLDRSL